MCTCSGPSPASPAGGYGAAPGPGWGAPSGAPHGPTDSPHTGHTRRLNSTGQPPGDEEQEKQKREVWNSDTMKRNQCLLSCVCYLTFPACCGQVFFPGGASRTVHSSLLLSGECWWASICEWQPGGDEPPNTPLIPRCGQGEGRSSMFRSKSSCLCRLLCLNFFYSIAWPRQRARIIIGLFMMAAGRMSALWTGMSCRRKAKHSDTGLFWSHSQLWVLYCRTFPQSIQTGARP